MMLACPVNKIGTVTLFQATHRGFVNGLSGAPPLVWAVKPQVVVVNNEPVKAWPPTRMKPSPRSRGSKAPGRSTAQLRPTTPITRRRK